eukprot:TRINITY_DN13750_c0_g1_i1.p1 TRINITY_DN13750_c0_g1~~TRINITY_DN13750_c0_g1_i1.p1  ORF type:complete len:105 (-),score=12.79 TRINITY_DN13750_c0_g1_i1:1290-1604(-)
MCGLPCVPVTLVKIQKKKKKAKRKKHTSLEVQDGKNAAKRDENINKKAPIHFRSICDITKMRTFSPPPAYGQYEECVGKYLDFGHQMEISMAYGHYTEKTPIKK